MEAGRTIQKNSPEAAAAFAKMRESREFFANAAGRFFEAWKRGVELARPHYFGDGTKEGLAAARDKNDLAPDLKRISDALGVLSHGEVVFLVSMYAFYNDQTAAKLWSKAGVKTIGDLSALDLERRQVIADLLVNYVGW